MSTVWQQDPFTGSMYAEPHTARGMGTAMARAALRSPQTLITYALLAVVFTLLALLDDNYGWLAAVVFGIPFSAWSVGRRMHRVARQWAPAGAVLAVTVGPYSLAYRHALASVEMPYTSWDSAGERNGFILLQRNRNRAVLALPAALFPHDFPRNFAAVRGTLPRPTP